jgi:hypothetical protein
MFHPLVKARAYAALPGHPGVVNAVGAVFTPIDVLAPLGLGALSAAYGSHVAVAALASIPIVMLAIGWRANR